MKQLGDVLVFRWIVLWGVLLRNFFYFRGGADMTTVLTYGTFDLLHVGHTNILQRARDLGDRLIVGVSTDEFCREKGKTPVIPFEDRARLVAALRAVDRVIPETRWEQKALDVIEHRVDVFVMGDDWEGKFDFLRDLCDVVYLPRTADISTTILKKHLREGQPYGLRRAV